jgi:PAS domain S-box-containing protein
MEAGSRELSVLTALAHGVTRADARGFFAGLVSSVTEALGSSEAIVTERTAAGETRVIARSQPPTPGAATVPVRSGSPCEEVLSGRSVYCPRSVPSRYPGCEADVESYIGSPLKGERGEVLGHLASYGPRPMALAPAQRLAFEIFADRAAAELRRLRLERDARNSEERFRDLFDEAPIAYVHEDLDSRFIRANRSALRILGLTADQVAEGFRGVSLVPDIEDAKRRVREALESVGSGIDTSGVVLELRRADNHKPIFIQWWSRPDPGGSYTRTMFLDITDRVLMEREQARLQAENVYLQEEIKSVHNFEEIIGASAGLVDVLENVRRVAPTDTAVLICGETGTGKELIARAIHSTSRRAAKPFIKLNCAALPSGLVESELFGHERGAFSGALQRRIGRFELAHNGTIFLDEIGEMPLEVQAKLLRVLQEQEFERVGSSHTTKVDVRVIAATNRDLARAVREGSFRQDLYYRLSVFPVTLPALRERTEDIPLLVAFFAQKYGPRVGRRIESVSAETLQRLRDYPWPGNIRELENLIERALILANSSVLEVSPEVLGPGLAAARPRNTPRPEVAPPPASQPAAPPLAEEDSTSLAAVQREHILKVLHAVGWVIEGERGAAARLGMKPATLRFRMKKFGISRTAERS